MATLLEKSETGNNESSNPAAAPIKTFAIGFMLLTNVGLFVAMVNLWI